MAFVSLPFVVFVAATALAYFLCPQRFQWTVLLIASYVYFWINSEWLVLVMFAATAVTFYISKIIYAINDKAKRYLKDNAKGMTAQERKDYKNKTKKKNRNILLVGVCFDLGILAVLKYFNFFADISNVFLQYLGVEIPRMRFLMPLGISFYTLQAIAYMTDVYRDKYEPDDNLGQFMLFMSYFPQIVQGPIARHAQLAHQLYEGHKFDYRRVMFGAQLILWGFMKKMIIADRIAVVANEIFDYYLNYTGLMIFLGSAFYGIQVYTDFSGGMDIARGVSQIFGIELELNFKQPYFSKSIEEFWRRWHITLGAWMREYVFYPLSLSKLFGRMSKSARKLFGQFVGKRLPAFLAMFIVYFLVGIWHGPSWKYIAYGVWNGVFIVAGILLTEFYETLRKKCGIQSESYSWRMFQIIRTFVLVSFGRIFSRAASLRVSLKMFEQMMVDWCDLSFIVDGSLTKLGLDTGNWIVLIIAVVVLLAVDYLHENGIQIRDRIARQNIIFRWAIYYAAILLLLLFGMYGPGYDSASFIYEQF